MIAIAVLLFSAASFAQERYVNSRFSFMVKQMC